MRLLRDLIVLTFFSQRWYCSNCILNETFEMSSVMEGSKGNVIVVVVIIIALVSSVVVPVVSRLLIAVLMFSIAVLIVSRLI